MLESHCIEIGLDIQHTDCISTDSVSDIGLQMSFDHLFASFPPLVQRNTVSFGEKTRQLFRLVGFKFSHSKSIQFS
jgi:hypothetical protein